MVVGEGRKKKKEKKSIVTAFRGRRMKTGCNSQSKKHNSFNCLAMAYPTRAICRHRFLINICIWSVCTLHPAAASCPRRPRAADGCAAAQHTPFPGVPPAKGQRCE